MKKEELFEIFKKREIRTSEILGQEYDVDDDELWDVFESLNETHIFYPSYDDFYRDYKWFKYHLIPVQNVGKKITDFHFQFGISTPNLHSYPQIVEKGIKNLKEMNFIVTDSDIQVYDNDYVTPTYSKILNGFYSFNGFTVEFIKSLESPLNPDNENYIQQVKDRLVSYYCWDKMNKEELIRKISYGYGIFLGSTIELIGSETISRFLGKKYTSKDRLIEDILSNLILDNDWINQKMRVLCEGNFCIDFPVDDYSWLFGTNFTRSVRIFENELRLENGMKVIGSFYSEDLLFKSVNYLFGNKYQIISQGSPRWLKPQRIDIYIPELNIGIEYQGEQHYRPVDFGGKGKKFSNKQFKENQIRDEIKKKKCLDNDCLLLEMRYDDNFEEFIDKVKKSVMNREQSLNKKFL